MAPPAELGTAAIESVAPSTFPPSVSNGTVGIGALASRRASKGFDLRPLRLSASSLAHRSTGRRQFSERVAP